MEPHDRFAAVLTYEIAKRTNTNQIRIHILAFIYFCWVWWSNQIFMYTTLKKSTQLVIVFYFFRS